jgi:hypothetical protein
MIVQERVMRVKVAEDTLVDRETTMVLQVTDLNIINPCMLLPERI